MSSRARTGAALLAAIPLAAALGSCSTVRQHTYGPEFNYVPQERLESTMWRLAVHLDELDRRLRSPEATSPAVQADIVRTLAEMESATRELGPGGWPSNHPRVSRNVDSFRSALEAARRAAALRPPNYFLAGRISESCLHCHEGR